jgi:DNA primase
MEQISRAQSSLETGRQPYTVRAAARKLKEEISIEDFLRKHGEEPKRNRARCIVHDGDNPYSFSINAEKQLWHCFACNEGGDLIHLCELVEKHADTWTACVSLSMQFDVQIPRRSETCRKWSSEKYKIRDGVQKHLARVYQRRLTRVYAPLVLLGGESPAEELEALDELARALWPFCYELAGRRVHG